MKRRCIACHGSGKIDNLSIKPKTCSLCDGAGFYYDEAKEVSEEEFIIPKKKKKTKKQAEIIL